MRTVSSKLQLCDGCASRYRGAPRRLLERKYSPNTKLRAIVEAQTALGLTGNTLHELPDTAPRLVRRIRERKQLQSDQTHHAPVNTWAWATRAGWTVRRALRCMVWCSTVTMRAAHPARSPR